MEYLGDGFRIARTDFLIAYVLSVHYSESLFVFLLRCIIKGPSILGARVGEGRNSLPAM